jgi:hypothetical protein
MKRSLFCLVLIIAMSFPTFTKAYAQQRPTHRRHGRAAVKKIEEPAPQPACVPSQEGRTVKLMSWEPKQKIAKFLGVLKECETTQWDVLKLLSGPNAIGLHYPDEKEMWSYLWMWSYDLKNPIEDTIILMDQSGKRMKKGKNPVELYLVFNKQDVLERAYMILVKKKSNSSMVVP